MLVVTQVAVDAAVARARRARRSRASITVRQILVLQVVQGVINAFDTPARQAFVVEMVEDRADLPNAIALNSSMVNGSRIIGPSIGGVLIAAVGEGWCFLDRRDLLRRRDRVAAGDARAAARDRAPRPRRDVLEELRAGFRYVVGFAADPHRAAAAGDRERDGHAVHRADAGDRRAACCTAGRTRSGC